MWERKKKKTTSRGRRQTKNVQQLPQENTPEKKRKNEGAILTGLKRKKKRDRAEGSQKKGCAGMAASGLVCQKGKPLERQKSPAQRWGETVLG